MILRKMLIFFLVFIYIPRSVFAKSQSKPGRVNIYLITPLEIDQNLDNSKYSNIGPVSGAGASFNIDELSENGYVIFESSLNIFNNSLDCEGCKGNTPVLNTKIWESIFFSFKEKEKNKNKKVSVIHGLDANLVDLYSQTDHIVSINLLNTFIRSGYLVRLNDDKIIMTATIGVGGKYMLFRLDETHPDFDELNNRLALEKSKSLGGLQLALNAKVSLSIEDIIFMLYKYEVSFDEADLPRRRISEFSLKATPFKAVSSDNILKSLFIGVEHRDESIRVLDKDLDTSFNGATVGVSF